MNRSPRSLLVRLIGYAAAFDGALITGSVIAVLAPIVPPAIPLGVAAGYVTATLIYTHVLVTTSRPLDEGEPADRVILDAAERTATRLGLEPPRVLQTSAGGGLLNAFATDLVFGPPAIVLTDRTALLVRRGTVSPAALAGVISHELAHLAAGDSLPRAFLSACAVAARIAAVCAVLLLPFEAPRDLLLGSPGQFVLILLAPFFLSLLANALERAGERRADRVAASLEGASDLGGFLRQARDERSVATALRPTELNPSDATALVLSSRRELAERINRLNSCAVAAYHPVGAAASAPVPPVSTDPVSRRLALAARLRALAEEVDVRIAERVNREIARTMALTRRTLISTGYRDLAETLVNPALTLLAPRVQPSRRSVEHELSDLEAEAWRIGVFARSLRRLERRASAASRSPMGRAWSGSKHGVRLIIRAWLGRLSMNRTHPPLDERLSALD
jgi:Zn-dependent protease with chaperone function